VVTERDRAVLAFLGDHGGLRYDLVPLVLAQGGGGRLAPGRSPRAAYEWRRRMEAAGLVQRVELRRAAWLVLTRAGAAAVELPFDLPGRATDHMAWHATAVVLVRLWLAARHPGSAWTSERVFRSERRLTGARFRVPDGALDVPGKGRAGVEVELSPKRVSEYRSILRSSHPSLEVVWWFTIHRTNLQARFDRVERPARPEHHVLAMPAGTWPPEPLGGRWVL
jgi:hypothetical protein